MCARCRADDCGYEVPWEFYAGSLAVGVAPFVGVFGGRLMLLAYFLAVAAVSAFVWAVRAEDSNQAAAAALIASTCAVMAGLVLL